jgi:hypothetical protein
MRSAALIIAGLDAALSIFILCDLLFFSPAIRRREDPLIRFLHCLPFVLVATIFVLAFSIDLARSKEAAGVLIQLHRSFGVTLWGRDLIRLVWRQFSHFPNWPADMPQLCIVSRGSRKRARYRSARPVAANCIYHGALLG